MKNDFIMKKEIRNIGLSAFRVMVMLPALLFAGCVARETEGIEVPDEAAVPIEFGITGTTVTAQTGDPTRSGEVSSPLIDFLGWEHTDNWKTSAWTWKAALADAESGAASTADGTTKNFALAPRKYYNADENTKTSLIGFYPPIDISPNYTVRPALRGESVDDAVKYGFVVYPSDGTVDVITSDRVTGSKNTPVGNITLRHVTSQIALKIKAKDGFYDIVKNIEIQKVTLKDPDDKIYVPSRITVGGQICGRAVLDVFTVFTGTETSKMYVPQTAQSIGIPAFLTPGSAVPKIEVTLSGRGAVTCPITGITSLEAGKKYIITIDVSSSSLNVASATITDWEAGTTLESDATL